MHMQRQKWLINKSIKLSDMLIKGQKKDKEMAKRLKCIHCLWKSQIQTPAQYGPYGAIIIQSDR